MKSENLTYTTLLLPKEKNIQLVTLIKKLGDGWDAEKVERTLRILKSKDKVIKWSSNIIIKSRTISLRQFTSEEKNTFVSSISADEKILFEELEKWKPRSIK
jgi:hypothetical protein